VAVKNPRSTGIEDHLSLRLHIATHIIQGDIRRDR